MDKYEKLEKALAVVLNWIPILLSLAVTTLVIICTPSSIEPREYLFSRLWCVARITSSVSAGFAVGAAVAWLFYKAVDAVEDRFSLCFGIVSYSVRTTATALWSVAIVTLVPTVLWWIPWIV